MIYCLISGGLGNQLFEIFTTIAYSIKLCRKSLFLYEDFNKNGCIIRPTYWNTFLKPIKYMATSPLPNSIIIKEKHFHYENLIFPNNNENVILNGYFQSYKYFDEYKDTLFNLIRLEKTREKVIKLYNILNTSGEKYETFNEIISMHFRVGDYIKYPDIHPILSYDYYYNSLSFILKNGGNYVVLYFCEDSDIEHVNSYITRLQHDFYNVSFQRAPEIMEDWQQLILISCCRCNIMANSTFSWWGSYFNRNYNKVICYPSIWFGKKLGHNTQDLFQPIWNKIGVDNTICC